MKGTMKRSDGRTYEIDLLMPDYSLTFSALAQSLRGTKITEVYPMEDGTSNVKLTVKNGKLHASLCGFKANFGEITNIYFPFDQCEIVQHEFEKQFRIEIRFRTGELILTYNGVHPEKKKFYDAHWNLLKKHLDLEF